MVYTPAVKEAKEKVVSIAIKTDNTVEKVTFPVYFVSILVLHILYVLVFFGIYKVDPLYIRYLSTFVQIFVGLFLLIRFNPFSKIRSNPNDRSIIFGAAIFILTNTLFTESFIKNTEKQVSQLAPWMNSVMTTNGALPSDSPSVMTSSPSIFTSTPSDVTLTSAPSIMTSAPLDTSSPPIFTTAPSIMTSAPLDTSSPPIFTPGPTI
jgi:hypothetical protein